MLQGEFFKIISSETLPDGSSATGTLAMRTVVRLDPGHRIYHGHFPGNPVVPGVCQVQMAREVLESVMNVKGMLVSGDNIKFLNIIDPAEHPVLTIDYTIKDPVGDNLPFSAILRDDSMIFMKFKGILCTRQY
jgi:3-hydroxyacyl-[acyl-carrier-protein] dehydratase